MVTLYTSPLAICPIGALVSFNLYSCPDGIFVNLTTPSASETETISEIDTLSSNCSILRQVTQEVLWLNVNSAPETEILFPESSILLKENSPKYPTTLGIL